MSKAQYLLLAIFIGFYGLLFTFLLARAFATATASRMRATEVVDVPQQLKRRQRRRAWTAALKRHA